jgi:hypothetical protein
MKIRLLWCLVFVCVVTQLKPTALAQTATPRFETEISSQEGLEYLRLSEPPKGFSATAYLVATVSLADAISSLKAGKEPVLLTRSQAEKTNCTVLIA